MRVKDKYSSGDPRPESKTMTLQSSHLYCFLLFILIQISFTSAARGNPPGRPSASEIQPTSLKVSWTRGNVDDISYIVQYKAKQDSRWYEKVGIEGTEFVITQMQPFQNYEIRVLALTKTGRTSPSPTIEVVTGEIGGYL